MSKFRSLFLAACVPFAVLLSSCGIRIPESPEVKRVAVRAEASAVPSVPDESAKPGEEPKVLVYLLADNLHTGMVFPYDWLLENGFRPPANFGRPKYVAMSWGNREAYVQEQWLTVWQAVRALGAPSPSVMELIPFDYDVVEVCHHQRIYKKLVDRDRGPSVAAFLNGCTRRGADGLPGVIGKSSWGNGVLLDSPHSYHLPRICNVWTLQAMEACGCRIHPWFGLTADGVVRQAQGRGNDFEKIWEGYALETQSGT